MSNCALDLPIPNTSLSYGDVLNGTHQAIEGAWYLRPDTGGAVLPWVYTIILIVIHAPTVIIRVVRWEMVQTWCLVATLLTVVLFIQTYTSTRFAPAQVLTWTPIVLVIDAGSMLQLFVLVVEKGSLGIRVRDELRATYLSLRRTLHIPFRKRSEPAQPLVRQQDEEGIEPAQPLLRQQDETIGPLHTDRTFYIAISALLLFLAVFVLQILALQAAVKIVNGSAPLVSWCSPMFQPFGAAVIDGDCHIYAITRHEKSTGIGCILIPGQQQKSWILLTLIITVAALVMEFVDLAILTYVNTKTKCNGVKMRRPWCTMFGGLVVLGITLGFGLMYAQYLPPGISSRITIVTNVQNRTFFYTGRLFTAGLRGALLAWNDGVFSSWGNWYNGFPT